MTDATKVNMGSNPATVEIPMPLLPTAPGTPLLIDPGLPSDPVLRKISIDILNEAKYAFVVTASGTAIGPTGGFGPSFSKYLESRRPKTREIYQTYASMYLAAPAAVREAYFGQYANIQASRYALLTSSDIDRMRGFLATGLAIRNAIDAAVSGLKNIAKPQSQFFPTNLLRDVVDLQNGLKYKTLQLFINNVHCFEETSGLLEGSDEINMGGTIVDPFGNATEIGEFVISDDFSEDDTVSYPGGKQFGLYTLDTQPPWPHSYIATIVLAEKDAGGFADFLNQLWAQIKDKVIAAISAAGGVAAGAALGTALGGIVGSAVGAIVGLLVGWLIDLFDNPDDIVGVRTATYTLAAETKSYYDWAKLTTSGGFTWNMNFQDDGHYQVNCGFRLVNP